MRRLDAGDIESKFHVYGPSDLDNPEMICLDGFAGLIFEGYFVWFSFNLRAQDTYYQISCGIRLTEMTHTIAWGNSTTIKQAFKNALKDFEAKGY